MVKKLNVFFLLFVVILFSCEDKSREWDNPYDPRSKKSLWTPDNLFIDQVTENSIEITWERKGRQFDGYIIDRKIGLEEWVNMDSLLDDEITNWIDTINLKNLVANHVEYQYRLYAYADTNLSLKKIKNIKPAIPGPPGSVSLIDVNFDHEPSKKLTIRWQRSIEPDFFSYNVLHAASEEGLKTIYSSVQNINTTTIDTSIFNVMRDNWFWIEVEDTTGQKTIGNSFNLKRDPPPIPPVLNSIFFDNKRFYFSWNPTFETDISSYLVEQISPLDSNVISNSIVIEKNKTNFDQEIAYDIENYYRVKISDVWGNFAYSNVNPASSYQKIVMLDTVTESGNDIIIMNVGPTMPFMRTLSDLKASFPIWIQGGDRIFSFANNNVGYVIDQNGINIKSISGTKPQDISFNSDQTEALFVGTDDDIYIAYLNEDNSTARITRNTNNEWYSDPQFISNDTKILYAQRKHLSNNNVGTINIYTMDRDGKNPTQISDATKEEKFIMPRMSSSEDKIIYYFKDIGMYELSYPLEKRGSLVETEGGASIKPEISSYFRNIRWSPNGQMAIVWEKDIIYNLYLYEKNASTKLRFFQSNARYAQWNGNDEVIFKYESSDGMMYRKNVNSSISDDPILFYEKEWVQLQPRQ